MMNDFFEKLLAPPDSVENGVYFHGSDADGDPFDERAVRRGVKIELVHTLYICRKGVPKCQCS